MVYYFYKECILSIEFSTIHKDHFECTDHAVINSLLELDNAAFIILSKQHCEEKVNITKICPCIISKLSDIILLPFTAAAAARVR